MTTLQAMYRDWPFFTTMLSNMDMVLAKSDSAIASRYAELVSYPTLREAIFGRLRAEWSASVRALLAITEQKTLLEQNPLLARSIRNRFPQIDPLGGQLWRSFGRPFQLPLCADNKPIRC
jgi:phosphoenolpyruvate carboxylase